VRRIYACLLEFADASGRDPLAARAITKRWVGGHHGGWPTDALDRWEPARDQRVHWRTVEHDGAVAFELTWTRPHAQDRTLWRRTLVQIITTAAADGHVVVAERLESHDPKVRGHPADDASAHELVREIVDAVHCVDGGWSVRAVPHRADATRAMELDAFVRGGRRLPVVLVAADRAGRVAADAAGFAATLAGLAHVVVLVDDAAVRAVAAEIGNARAVESGGVRLLWPDWRSNDPSGRHPHWRAEEVAGPDGPRPRVLAALHDVVVDAATLRIDDDVFVARLARADSAHELAHRRAELAKRQQAALDDRAAAHELVDEYQRELTIADDEVFRLEAALEREHELRLRAEHAYLHLATRDGDAAATADPEMRTLGDVVRLAKVRLRHLVILPEAERSARTWAFDRVDLAWADLVRLDSVAADWAADRLPADFALEARARGLDWARDVSEPARQKFPADYQRRYDGRTVELGPHIRRTGRQLLRVYCYLDAARRVVVVGHVGGHLGDSTV